MLSLGDIKKNMNKLTIIAVFFGLAFAASAQAADVSVSLRYQDTLLLDEVSFELPSPGTLTVTDTKGEDRSLNAQSVLGILAAIDSTDTSFEISKIQYFASYSSLYLQCITGTSMGSEQCDNWLYVVNGADPGIGMDAKVLTGGEQVYIYFGPSHQVLLSTAKISKGTSFQATTQKYQYQDNTWGALTGVTVGFTQSNPENSFSPIEVLLKSVDEVGRVSLNLDIPVGDYNVGIKEDYYFPSTQLTVVELTSSVQSGGGGGGGAPAVVHQNLDVEKAMQFLIANQNEDGSFSSATFLNDWAAVAFGAYGKESPAREKLEEWMVNNPIPQGSLLTDYERRAMALMSLGINPFDGTSVNYIMSILQEFDGEQFGNPNLVNDDIFAAIVLKKAGYDEGDAPLLQTLSSIYSWQQENGSFGSVDLTAAAIQMLSLLSSTAERDEALERAGEYLLSRKESSGGFSNAYSTSWALQAILALGDSWEIDSRTSEHFLALLQNTDGGLLMGESVENRIWSTAYAIPARLQKTWGDVLGDYENPAAVIITTSWTPNTDIGEDAVAIDIPQETISSSDSTGDLEVIEAEILAIAQRVEELRPQVTRLYTAHLAQVEQERILASAKEPVSELTQLSLVKDSSAILNSQATVSKRDEGKLTAEVASPVEKFIRSGTGQAVLALGAGIILFLVLGGAKAIGSLVRPKNTAIEAWKPE